MRRGAPRVLLFRNDRLGDLVLALPTLDALRRAFPQARLGMLVSAYGAPLVEKDPRLDEVVVDSRPDTLARLRAGGWEWALLLWATWSNAWLARRAGIPNRVGPSARPFSALLTHRLPIRRSRGEKSEAEYNLDHLAPLGLEEPRGEAALFLPPEDRREAARWMRAKGLKPAAGRPLVVLHPGTGGSSLRWGAGHFARLGALLRRRHGATLLVSGGEGEKALLREVAGGIHPRPAVLEGELPLRAFAALISRARLFVSAATGPMHIAAACGVPTLGIYPPIVPMSPLRWRPFGNRHAVLSPPGLGVTCPSCRGRACPFYDCMDRVTPEGALDAAAFLMRS